MTRMTDPKSITKILGRVAALALMASGAAGCDRANEARQESTASTFGMPALYGHVPTLAPDDEDQADQRQLAFAPEYYAVVYLKFDGAAHLTVKHGFFTDKGNNDDVLCALQYLTSPPQEETQEGQACTAHKKKPAGSDPVGPIFENFERFDFGTQQRVYVYIDNVDVAFSKDVPLSFTPYGAFDLPKSTDVIDSKWNGKNINLSFYNANVKPFEFSGKMGSLLSFENYFMGKDGNTPVADGSNNSRYSMNFNLRSCRKAGSPCDFSKRAQVIPLAIDPDTGNGWGNEP